MGKQIYCWMIFIFLFIIIHFLFSFNFFICAFISSILFVCFKPSIYYFRLFIVGNTRTSHPNFGVIYILFVNIS